LGFLVIENSVDILQIKLSLEDMFLLGVAAEIGPTKWQMASEVIMHRKLRNVVYFVSI